MIRIKILGIVLVLFLLQTHQVSAQLAQSAWPTVNHDMQRTGRTNAIGPTNPKVKWRNTNAISDHWGVQMRGTSIGADGKVYLGAGFGGSAALNKNTGATVWTYHLDNIFSTGPGGNEKWTEYPPTIGTDGTLYIPTEFGWVSAVDPVSGKPKWVAVSGKTEHAAAIDNDSIYFGSWDGNFYSYKTTPGGSGKDETNQRRKWTYKFASGSWLYTYGEPSIDSQGTVYLPFKGIYAFYPESKCANPLTHCAAQLKWSVSIPQVAEGFGYYGPTIDEARRTLYYNNHVRLYAVDMDTHVKKWEYNVNSNIRGRVPALGMDGTIYTGADNGFYAINPNGTLKWKKTTGRVEGSAIVDGNGTIFVWANGPSAHKLYAFNPDGSTRPNYPFSTGNADIGNFSDQSFSMDSDGTIYLPTGLNEVAAISEGGTSPQNTPTPTLTPTPTIPIINSPTPTRTPTPSPTTSQTTSPTPFYLRSDFGGLGGQKDGKVDIQDFNILAGEFYLTGATLKSNIINTGLSTDKVDIQDYNAFVGDYQAYLGR